MKSLKEMSLDELDNLLIGSDEMLPSLKSIYLDYDQSSDIKFGRKIKCSELEQLLKKLNFMMKKDFIGIGEE